MVFRSVRCGGVDPRHHFRGHGGTRVSPRSPAPTFFRATNASNDNGPDSSFNMESLAARIKELREAEENNASDEPENNLLPPRAQDEVDETNNDANGDANGDANDDHQGDTATRRPADAESTLSSLEALVPTPDGELLAREQQRLRDLRRLVFSEVGPGGFEPYELELLSLLGSLKVRRVSRVTEVSLSTDGVGSTTQSVELPSPSEIMVFAAEYISGRPFEGPLLVQLREYPGLAAEEIALQELRIMQRLLPRGIPENKFQAALPEDEVASTTSFQDGMGNSVTTEPSGAAAVLRNVPVVPAIGYFRAPMSRDAALTVTKNDDDDDDVWSTFEDPTPRSGDSVKRGGRPETFWLVLTFDRWRSVSDWYSTTQEEPRKKKKTTQPGALGTWLRRIGGGGVGGEGGEGGNGIGALVMNEDDELWTRKKYLEQLWLQSIRAVAYCHDRGVSHGAIGSGCLVINTVKDQNYARLRVRLDNFGYGVLTSHPSSSSLRQDDTAGTQAQDRRSLALMLLEFTLTGLSKMGGVAGKPWIGLETRNSSQERLSSILFSALGGDWTEFEEYCRQEIEWEEGVMWLDKNNKAGWIILERLMAEENLDLNNIVNLL